MSTNTVTRKTASQINPLISVLWTEDTLDNLAGMVHALGYLLSQVDHPPPGTEPTFGALWLLFSPLAAALEYERENIHSVVQVRKEKDHV